MAVNYSLISSPIGQPHQIKQCRSCGLYEYQNPLICRSKFAQVFWVGLSAVKLGDGDEGVPLSSSTPTGNLVHQIEEPFTGAISFYRTNLVKCAPLLNGKIRYPSKKEMKFCFPNLEEEISTLKPNVIFLLGKQVSNFVIEEENITLDENFSYQYHRKNNIFYVPVHHPSYVLVYKRKYLANYVANIRDLFSNLLSAKISTSRKDKVS